MIPVLFEKNSKVFNNNGIGRLSDAVSCVVTEVRNGAFELEMEFPVSGMYYKDIVISAIILAEPAQDKTWQPFRIYRVTKPLNGIVTVYAEHISYQMSHIPVSPFEADGVSAALSGIVSNAEEECPFGFWTDKAADGRFVVTTPSSMRSLLGGTTGSLLDTYGGELEFDNYAVKLWASRGSDRGVTLRYGKNITDLTQEECIASTITGIYPYWKSEDALVTLPEKIIHSENSGSFPYPRTKTLDMTTYFESQPTVEELRAAAQKYVKNNAMGTPKVSLSVSFAALWQTEEYKNIAPLEKLNLCDVVSVEYESLGVSAHAKVVSAEYDVLLGRYKKLSLGSVRASFEETVIEQQKVAERETSSALSTAVARATNMITGVNGGYVILHQDADGKPFEILIMDTDSIETATNVWRWNKNGWGHSPTGYNGPYTMAATIDGALVADSITSGTMQANRIKGGTLTLGGIDNGNGVMEVRDASGDLIMVIDKSGINAPERGDYTAPTIKLDAGTHDTRIEGYGVDVRDNLNGGGMDYGGTGISAIAIVDGEEKVVWNSYVSASNGLSYFIAFKNPSDLEEIAVIDYSTIKAIANGYSGHVVIDGESVFFNHGILQS